MLALFLSQLLGLIQNPKGIDFRLDFVHFGLTEVQICVTCATIWESFFALLRNFTSCFDYFYLKSKEGEKK